MIGGVALVGVHQQVALDVRIALVVIDHVVAGAGEDVVEDHGRGAAFDADAVEVEDVVVAGVLAKQVTLDDEPTVSQQVLGGAEIGAAEIAEARMANGQLRLPHVEVLRLHIVEG